MSMSREKVVANAILAGAMMFGGYKAGELRNDTPNQDVLHAGQAYEEEAARFDSLGGAESCGSIALSALRADSSEALGDIDRLEIVLNETCGDVGGTNRSLAASARVQYQKVAEAQQRIEDVNDAAHYSLAEKGQYITLGALFFGSIATARQAAKRLMVNNHSIRAQESHRYKD